LTRWVTIWPDASRARPLNCTPRDGGGWRCIDMNGVLLPPGRPVHAAVVCLWIFCSSRSTPQGGLNRVWRLPAPAGQGSTSLWGRTGRRPLQAQAAETMSLMCMTAANQSRSWFHVAPRGRAMQWRLADSPHCMAPPVTSFPALRARFNKQPEPLLHGSPEVSRVCEALLQGALPYHDSSDRRERICLTNPEVNHRSTSGLANEVSGISRHPEASTPGVTTERSEHYLKTSAGKAALKRMLRDALAELRK